MSEMRTGQFVAERLFEALSTKNSLGRACLTFGDLCLCPLLDEQRRNTRCVVNITRATGEVLCRSPSRVPCPAPTPLPFITDSFGAPVPTTSESDSDVPTQPTDCPAAATIAPASVVLSPKRRLDSFGVLQHMYEFGDVSVVLDSSARKLGSYETDDDGTMIRHRTVPMRSKGRNAKAGGLRKLLKFEAPGRESAGRSP